MSVKLKITSYETSGDERSRILSHTFYGKTLKEAVSYAKSHTITDHFFSSTFRGKMKWHDEELQLSYDIHTFGVKLGGADVALIRELEQYALKVSALQTELGMDDLIDEILRRIE